jgi:hypothetical protein
VPSPVSGRCPSWAHGSFSSGLLPVPAAFGHSPHAAGGRRAAPQPLQRRRFRLAATPAWPCNSRRAVVQAGSHPWLPAAITARSSMPGRASHTGSRHPAARPQHSTRHLGQAAPTRHHAAVHSGHRGPMPRTRLTRPGVARRGTRLRRRPAPDACDARCRPRRTHAVQPPADDASSSTREPGLRPLQLVHQRVTHRPVSRGQREQTRYPQPASTTQKFSAATGEHVFPTEHTPQAEAGQAPNAHSSKITSPSTKPPLPTSP